jgi:predicted Zn finger-like uncharacterized protein
MSLVTRCTSCGTLFKVVADQLKISEGWVRCGQCATVFDAQANLVEVPVQTVPPMPAQTPAQVDAPGGAFLGDSALDAQDREALLAAFASANVKITLPAKAESHSKPTNLQASALSAAALPAIQSPAHVDSQSFHPGKLRDGADLETEAGPSTGGWVASQYPAQAPEAADQAIEQPVQAMPEADTTGQSAAEQAMPQFVQQAQRAARWRSPWVRFALCMLALLLLSGLALQIALQDKDAIAAQWPQTKPWLEQMCQQAGCKVEALKRIEALTVDASSFNRINKNNAQLEATTQSYRLAVTLKNTGALPVAVPHVELSLQDAQDQPILRRVLSPADMGLSFVALSPMQDVSGALTLQVDASQLANRRIQGYRVLAFYP